MFSLYVCYVCYVCEMGRLYALVSGVRPVCVCVFYVRDMIAPCVCVVRDARAWCVSHVCGRCVA